MKAVEQEIDVLVQRLQYQAALKEVQGSLGIERWVKLWQQRLTPFCKDQSQKLYVAREPRLAELISAHHEAAVFVERAYMFLVGRHPDPEGAAYFQRLAIEEGRLSALVILLQHKEVQAYIQKEQLLLPLSLRRLKRCYQYLSVVPVVGRRCWRALALKLWQRYQLHWHEEGLYYQWLASEEQRHKDYQVLAASLIEMADIQAMIVDQLDISSASPKLKQHAKEMAEILENARQELQDSDRGTP